MGSSPVDFLSGRLILNQLLTQSTFTWTCIKCILTSDRVLESKRLLGEYHRSARLSSLTQTRSSGALIGADRTTWTGLEQHMEPDSLPTEASQVPPPSHGLYVRPVSKRHLSKAHLFMN